MSFRPVLTLRGPGEQEEGVDGGEDAERVLKHVEVEVGVAVEVEDGGAEHTEVVEVLVVDGGDDGQRTHRRCGRGSSGSGRWR